MAVARFFVSSRCRICYYAMQHVSVRDAARAGTRCGKRAGSEVFLSGLGGLFELAQKAS